MKVARVVLRGQRGSNAPELLDLGRAISQARLIRPQLGRRKSLSSYVTGEWYAMARSKLCMFCCMSIERSSV